MTKIGLALGGGGAKGISHLLILETLEEIATEGRKEYEHAGGKGFRYIPAMNDRDEHIESLTAIIADVI